MKFKLYVNINLSGSAPKYWGFSSDGTRIWATMGCSIRKKVFTASENLKTANKKIHDGYNSIGEYDLDTIEAVMVTLLPFGAVPGNEDPEVIDLIIKAGTQIKNDTIAASLQPSTSPNIVQKILSVLHWAERKIAIGKNETQNEPAQIPTNLSHKILSTDKIELSEHASAWTW